MINIDLDFETRSGKDLSTCGSLPYLWDKRADIVCLGYKVEEEKTQLWVPKMPLPEWMDHLPECNLSAHNAQFDMRVWHILGSRKYRFQKTKLQQWNDIMAICARFAFPQKLIEAGKALDLRQLKFDTGTALMRKICMPPFEYTPKELADFYDYCIRDVDSMHELKKALPASQLNESERKIWELTCKINMRGLPIDIESVAQILKVTTIYREEQNLRLPSITNGIVTKATQSKRIVDFIRTKGIVLKNLQADTVEKMLKKTNLPDDVKTILELRQELGKSSVAKYEKIMDLVFGDRVHDNIRYYGANTGRWTGMGFQLLNLPRSKVNEEAEDIITSFHDLSIIEKNPIQAAKSIVRQMVKAPDGKLLQFGDYASIEYAFLIWVTNDTVALQRFAEGYDQYKDMASARYGVPYEEVTDDQRYRGKQLILGCIGKGTPVLTDSGWKLIQDIEYGDLVFDGNSFVSHDGLKYQGSKKVNKISLTNDHLVLKGVEQWVQAGQIVESIEDMNQANKLATGLLMNIFMESIQDIQHGVQNAESIRLLMLITYIMECQHNVETVPEKLRIKCSTLIQELSGSLKKILIDYSTDFMQLGQDAQNLPHQNMTGMEAEESSLTLSLLEKLLRMSLPLKDGITQVWRSIELIITDTMKKEIYDLQQEVSKCITLTGTIDTYDVVNAGPNNRFMIMTAEGPLIVHNCGYGLGAKGFIGYCEQYDVYITDEEAAASVNAYRHKYAKIVSFWYNCKDAAINALTYPGTAFKVQNAVNVFYKFIKDRNGIQWLQCTLPSGRNIYYCSPMIGEGQYGPEISAMGINPYTKKWMRMSVIPGRLAENVSQATCRDVLVAGKMNLEDAGYKLIGSIYDEIIAEVDENNYSIEQFEKLACTMPDWAKGLPVRMESVVEKRYRKL